MSSSTSRAAGDDEGAESQQQRAACVQTRHDNDISELEARIWCEGAQSYTELFVADKMTRNDTLNKIHAAATELPQPLSKLMFGETVD